MAIDTRTESEVLLALVLPFLLLPGAQEASGVVDEAASQVILGVRLENGEGGGDEGFPPAWQHADPMVTRSRRGGYPAGSGRLGGRVPGRPQPTIIRRR